MTTIGHHIHRIPAATHTGELGRGVRHAVLVAGAVVLLLAATSAPPALVARSSTATGEPADSSTRLAAAVSSLEDTIADARDVLGASRGKVLDEAARTRLGVAVVETDAALLRVRERMVWPVDSISDAASPETLVARVAALGTPLDAGASAVRTDVAAWEAEQARIAAERAAAERAAAEAAARAPSRRAAATAVAAGGPTARFETIWTSGGQAEIDACRGSVNVSGIAGYLGAAFYAAEHWGCGGSAWGGVGTGAIVDFGGYGVYQVAGRVGGLAYGTTADALPGGYDGYYQTCVGGSGSNMTVWLLTRVG